MSRTRKMAPAETAANDDDDAPVPLVRRLASWGLQLGLSLAVLVGAVQGFKALGVRPKPARQAAPELAATRVEVAKVTRHGGVLPVQVGGLVRPWRVLRLATEVGGKVLRKADAARAGRWVAKGAVLYELEPRDFELAVRRAKSELEQAKRGLSELEIEESNAASMIDLATEDLALRAREVARQEDLRKREVAPETALDQARQREVQARTNLQNLRNQLRTTQTRRLRLEAAVDVAAARLAQAELDLSRTTIVAPVAGRVLEVHAEEGAYVNRGQTLIALEDNTRVEVRCTLRMSDLRLIWAQDRPADGGGATNGDASGGEGWRTDVPRTPAHVIATVAGRQHIWDGALERLDGEGVSDRTRLVPAVIVVHRPDVARGPTPHPPLLRGLWVQVELQLRPGVELLCLPERAVRPGGLVWKVAATDAGPVLKTLEVRVVRRENGVAYVAAGEGGLAAGDELVVSPLSLASDGMRLDPTAAREPSSASAAAEGEGR